MGRWLNQLRNGGNPKSAAAHTDKTDKTSSVGFVSTPAERFLNFQSGWDELDWQVAFDERAAILEYDEGLPRVESSRLARQQIDQLRGRGCSAATVNTGG